MSFAIAGSLDEALAALAVGARPIAGGTDLVVGARQGKAPLPASLVAIDRLDELAHIESRDRGIRIGAMVTHSQLMIDQMIVSGYTALADAAALVGSPSTRNIGTLGGNVMNASPAMDTGAPLMVLGAVAQLRSARGSRTVELSDLWTGPGQTSAETEELCVAIDLPPRPARSGSAYVRLEYRRAMEIAIVGAAASVTLADDGTILGGAVALSAVAPTIIEVDDAGALMTGHLPDAAAAAVATAASDVARPISDLRASDTYRRHTVGVMAARAVDAAARRAAGEEIGVPVNRAIGVGASR
ncbi:MAG: FAD binding domain-containing protein [Acidobacteria bacterium]|nr:FAD binding domain-containing protein [Acidobacteriota bacterium]TDI49747.1 MAG: xanthine dehydrogenase family protein subunit M [Acidobacteriota bacterium]TDI56271.1 MAG: xanthine dehydrogenase family protein subunit M [Acidobacteriota bacterium]